MAGEMAGTSTAVPIDYAKALRRKVKQPGTGAAPAGGNPSGNRSTGLMSAASGPKPTASPFDDTLLTETKQAQTTSAPAIASTAATPTATAAPAHAPAVSSFQYQGTTRTDRQLEAAARARAAILVNGQREEALAAQRRSEQQAGMLRDQTNRQEAAARESNRGQWGAANLGTSGFLAGANALAQLGAAQEMGRINTEEQLAQENYADRLRAIASQEGNAQVAYLNDLQQQERQFGLQERAQQYNEFSGDRSFNRGVYQDDRDYARRTMESDRDYGLRQQDLGSVLAQRAFELSRGQQMLPYELDSARLGNEQAGFNLSRGQQLLPYELEGARLGNQTAQAQYNDQYTQGGLGYQLRQYQVQGAQLENQRQTLANRMADLEYTIANDPDVGAKQKAVLELQTARKQLEVMDSQIASNRALTAQRLADSSGVDPTKTNTPAYVAQRHGNFNQGWTRNFSALDGHISELRQALQTGQIQTVDDVAEALDSGLAQQLAEQGVDPAAILEWAKANIKRTREQDRINSER